MIGGVTAHLLPMTKAERSELLIYDLAVREDRQREGIGQMLIDWVVKEALTRSGLSVFVLADDVDKNAVRFYRQLNGIASPVTLFAWDGPVI